MLYRVVGFVFLGLALTGIALPLLPTTPFLLLAAACFAKSSPKWHQWLLNHRAFGPTIRRWQEKRCISAKAKVLALVCLSLFGGYSIFFAIDNFIVKVVGGSVILYGFWFVLSIKTCKD